MWCRLWNEGEAGICTLHCTRGVERRLVVSGEWRVAAASQPSRPPARASLSPSPPRGEGPGVRGRRREFEHDTGRAGDKNCRPRKARLVADRRGLETCRGRSALADHLALHSDKPSGGEQGAPFSPRPSLSRRSGRWFAGPPRTPHRVRRTQYRVRPAIIRATVTHLRATCTPTHATNRSPSGLYAAFGVAKNFGGRDNN